MNFKLGRHIHRVHANKSPLKIWENGDRGRIQGLPKFFEYPLLSQERVKLRTFCRHILSIDRNKSPLQISGKVVGCVVRTLKTFQCTHILGASRGLLCDSSAVLCFSCAYIFRLQKTGCRGCCWVSPPDATHVSLSAALRRNVFDCGFFTNLLVAVSPNCHDWPRLRYDLCCCCCCWVYFTSPI